MADLVIAEKAALIATADAIREKAGTTDLIAWDETAGFSDVVSAIESGIDTSDATATEDDVLKNATFYANGEKKTGTLTQQHMLDLYSGAISGGYTIFTVMAQNQSKCILADQAYITIEIKSSSFGNATPADVVYGKMFTSSSGLRVRGTYQKPVSAGGVDF